MKNFLKNYWRWIVSIILSAVSVTLVSLCIKSVSGLIFFGLLSFYWFRVLFYCLSNIEELKERTEQRAVFLFSQFWFLTAVSICTLGSPYWIIPVFVCLLAYGVLIASLTKVSGVWLIILVLGFFISFLGQSLYNLQKAPKQTDVVLQMYQYQGHCYIILENEGFHAFPASDYNLIKPGDTISFKMIDDGLRQIKRH